MKAIILAAGYATRLYPLTLNKPKMLLSVKGKPILEYILLKIKEIKDIDEIIIVTNDKFFYSVNKWADKNKKRLGIKIKIVNDKTNFDNTRLGGITDLWLGIEKEKIKEDILVLNSDNLYDFSLEGAVELFEKKKAVVNGVYLVKNKEEAKRHGVVELVGNKIESFEEKPAEPKSLLTSIGVYIIPAKFIPEIKKYIENGGNKEGPGFLIKYFAENFEAYGYKFEGRLFDIGNLESYENAEKEW